MLIASWPPWQRVETTEIPTSELTAKYYSVLNKGLKKGGFLFVIPATKQVNLEMMLSDRSQTERINTVW